MTRKLQIGVMGSTADMRYSKRVEKIAERLGFEIARAGATLLFGAEKDSDSLSTAACRGAKKAGGLTVGVTYEKGLDVWEKNADVVIASGLVRGGGRETTLVLSCDGVITLGGGSGTLNEIAVAYQANIPVVALKNTGGWSGKLAGTYLDARKRFRIEPASYAKEAVEKMMILVRERRQAGLVFLTAVHGDEKIGVEAMQTLEKEGLAPNWIIANEKALAVNKRYVDADMNRSAPGSGGSRRYEVRRVSQVLRGLQNAKNVIDIHGTVARCGICTIVTNPTIQNLRFAGCLPVEKIVIWPGAGNNGPGPVVNFVNCGVEIECGPKNSPLVKKQLLGIARKIILSEKSWDRPNFQNKKVYRVSGKFPGRNGARLKDFAPAIVRGKRILPFLAGQYPGIVCYCLQLLNSNDLKAYGI